MKTSDGRDEILRYIERHGVRDKDANGAAGTKARVKAATKTRRGLTRKVLDLHGMISEDAEQALANAIKECKKRGIKELLVIHGRGRHSDPPEGGVLKKLVCDNFDFRHCAAIRGYTTALPSDGGEGATLVVLK